MTKILKLSNQELRARIRDYWSAPWSESGRYVYGVPRGGWNIAEIISSMNLGAQVDEPEQATIIVDDIIDSGATRDKWLQRFPDKKFWAPFDKTIDPNIPWVVFPWEESAEVDAEDIVRRQLEFIGEDPKRPGLIDTPKRVVKAWSELFNGYGQDPADLLSRVFPSDNDAMVVCRDIEFYSTCEHHLIPFYGTASLGYLPKGKVIGLSKMARLVDLFARRLQLQEQLTHQVAEVLNKIPDALGAGVVVRAKHLCMCGRGVGKQGSSMVTSAMLGKFRDDPAVRSEFMGLIA